MEIFSCYLHFRLFCLPQTLWTCGADNEKIVQSDSDYQSFYWELLSWDKYIKKNFKWISRALT